MEQYTYCLTGRGRGMSVDKYTLIGLLLGSSARDGLTDRRAVLLATGPD